MKKIIGIVLSTLFLLVLSCFTLTACGHEHRYASELFVPTCTTDGYTKHTCECGDTYNSRIVAKLGHSFTNYVSNNDATCTEDGTKTATCDRNCGGTDTITDVGTKGHDFDNGEYAFDTAGHWKVCANCTEEDTDNKESHEGGVADYFFGKICQICSQEYTEKLPYEFTATETELDKQMFVPAYHLYTVSVTTDHVIEGDTAFQFSAIPKWPEWKFSSGFISWLNTNEYDYLSFKIYFDAANSATALNTDSWGIQGLAGTNCDTDRWLTVAVDVSSLTTETTLFILNKNEEKEFNVYIDDIEFLKKGDFPGEESVLDLAMFTLSGNAQIAINLNPDFIKEGASSIRLHSPSQWPRYNFSQTFIDWLVANEYTTLSFDLYIDNAGSNADVTMVEQSGISGVTLTTDQWYSVSVNVADLSTNTWFQFNKNTTSDLGVYLDNVQFAK